MNDNGGALWEMGQEAREIVKVSRGKAQSSMSNDDISDRWRAAYLTALETRINRFIGLSIHEQSRLSIIRFLIFGWPLLCIALVIARFAKVVSLPWLVVLAPIWFPMVSIGLVLLAAMWLDKLSSRMNDE